MSEHERTTPEADEVEAHRSASFTDDDADRTDPDATAETEEADVEGHRVTPRITPRTST